MSSSFIIKDGVLIGFCHISFNGDITIPKNVSEIAPNVFKGCTSLTSVTIPDGVTKIDENAFCGCTNLIQIILPESVTQIGEAAFADCKNLKSIVLPSGLKKIEGELFSGCTSLNDISLPANIECIDELAFAYNSSLTTISISINIKRIVLDNCCSAFYGCTALENVDIIDDPSENAPYKDYAGYYRSHDGVLYSGDEDESLVFVPPAKTGNFRIPDNVEKIRESSFSGSRIRSVYIPASVKMIERWAFNNCEQLENIFVDPKNRHFTDYSGILYNKNEHTLVRCPEGKTSVVLSEHTRTIDECAFNSCKEIRKLTIPDKTVKISDFAFVNCTSLTEINIPPSITDLGYCAFDDTPWLHNIKTKCNGLVIVNNILLSVDACFNAYGTICVPEGVKKIAPCAFSCSNCKDVYLPETVTEIGESAFRFCSNLEKIVLKGVRTIGNQAFEECTLLEEITLPSSIRHIKNAFEDAISLSQINIDNNKSRYLSSKNGVLYSRDGKTLELCPPACRELIIAEGTQIIRSDALKFCDKIKRLILPRSLEKEQLDIVFKALKDNIDDLDSIMTYCIRNSPAHRYCEENNIIYELI